eukprot:SAG11_NODE_2113_length_3799_cov_7.730000_2_plen_81_part_00
MEERRRALRLQDENEALRSKLAAQRSSRRGVEEAVRRAQRDRLSIEAKLQVRMTNHVDSLPKAHGPSAKLVSSDIRTEPQ